ncbi:hypothetical protein A3E96_01600 [Candidatus Uhrbacteria bacterium RIFCSPHIGHO2_12_FULL_46_13]|nr:MAG: hypothetical protein UX68_C0018G0021 [Parcubacteria group bacterium GW2011_GWA2_46_9]OGL58886.1 MAG: hypothetical protein A2752_04885 [Candidatus Uhrbacteria bacterium RIFCSPHIGHO2_01_FULL_46_23]OGL69410.1 MAG: hypothetical protein A3D60_01040 [Candidatus Uhrbacteria bacterium RIFCSPHIGHO2_02_FULL_47_29]OGL76788.1 MAG: hypothetical protein A3E96_01600 [Candidatus Uhrbacteria bacterium RIFCSPHIGHO2_12_FULL_46_13]
MTKKQRRFFGLVVLYGFAAILVGLTICVAINSPTKPTGQSIARKVEARRAAAEAAAMNEECERNAAKYGGICGKSLLP